MIWLAATIAIFVIMMAVSIRNAKVMTPEEEEILEEYDKKNRIR